LEVLHECAEELIDGLVLQHLQAEVNDVLMRAIKIGGNRGASDPMPKARLAVTTAVSSAA
jgi:hypothetical protein